MSVAKVLRWLDALTPPQNSGLSDEGAQEALSAARTPIQEFLKNVPSTVFRGRYGHVTMVASRTVFTAPLEWVALLLASGSTVRLKRPEAGLSIWDSWVKTAENLPLTITTERTLLHDTELVIAMGSDETIATLKEQCLTGPEFLGFGSKFSIALVTNETVIQDSKTPNDVWGRIAADVALYDTRGCMSPSIVLTTTPLHEAIPRLAHAMESANVIWPRGTISDFEGAKIRERIVLSKLVGQVVEEKAFSILGLPLHYTSTAALPRVLQVVHVDSIADMLSYVMEHAGQLSTVGTDLSDDTIFNDIAPHTRVCKLGQMQRPPILRLHDGIPWIDKLFVTT